MPEPYPPGRQPPAPGATPSPPPAYSEEYPPPYPPQQYPTEAYPPQAFRPQPYPGEPYPDGSYPDGSYQPGYPAEPYGQQGHAYPPGPYAPESYPPESHQAQPYPPETFQQEPYQQDAYQQDAYQQETYQQDAYQQETYQRDAYPEEPHSSEVYALAQPPEPPGAAPVQRERRQVSAGMPPARLLAVLGLVVLIAGLALPEGGDNSFGRVTLWALFAAGCGVAVLVGVFRAVDAGVRLAVLAAAGLAGYWVLLVLPGVASQTGFLQTAACALACGAAWLHRTGPATGR